MGHFVSLAPVVAAVVSPSVTQSAEQAEPALARHSVSMGHLAYTTIFLTLTHILIMSLMHQMNMYSSRFIFFRLLVKFGLLEKHTKFEKIFLMVLTNQLIYIVNVKTMRKIFLNYVCFSKSSNFNKRVLGPKIT